MSSSHLIRDFLRARPCARPPLLSTAFYHTTAMDGARFDEHLSDPTWFTRVLLDQHRLLNTDAIAIRVDPVLVALALDTPIGWDQAIPTVDEDQIQRAEMPRDRDWATQVLAPLFDVCDRLVTEVRRKLPVMSVLPAPDVFARQIGAKDPAAATEFLQAAVDGLGKAGSKLFLFEEIDDEVGVDELKRSLTPLINTARYYTANSIISRSSDKPILFGDAQFYPNVPIEKIAGEHVGVSIPESCFSDDQALDGFMAEVSARSSMPAVTVDDAVLFLSPPERNAEVLGKIASMEML